MIVDAGQAQAQTNRERLGLLARIGRAYGTVTEPIRAGAIEVQFTRIADPNRVLDEVALEEDRRERLTGQRKREDELHLPYWAELWESSIGLAAYLADEWAACGSRRSAVAMLAHAAMARRNRPAVKVMDLGCGMGLAGVVAARLGAEVLFADLEPPCLLFARLNSLADADRCRTRKTNWQTDRLGERFDLILGADIVYDRSQWVHLEPFFCHHLAEDGAVLLGEPGRSSGQEFEPWITGRGWRLIRREQKLPGRDHPIKLMELSRM